ncbi:hypothetical protein [Calothrix sp. PCC 6303]|uniref:hypothetical protein n=1 Tax=Calothrix sp. PCC 6303 TaxID=1170562 RepID=UPI0005A1A3C5|nr:hypothetical protein [Calothrix sp. PCC 6303]
MKKQGGSRKFVGKVSFFQSLAGRKPTPPPATTGETPATQWLNFAFTQSFSRQAARGKSHSRGFVPLAALSVSNNCL